MKKISPIQRLKAAHILLNTDTAFDADCINNGVQSVKKGDTKRFTKLIIDLYKVIHPEFCNTHNDDFTREILKNGIN
jgi:hypothetical protein